MFISAIRLHYNLNGATLTSAASDCTRRNKAFSFLSVISEAHCSIFERLGYSSEFWVLVEELPLVFTFIPTISMPTVKYPLYFRCVLNSLFVFWFCVFVWEKKKSEGCHICCSARVTSKKETGCHFTISATFLGAPWIGKAEVESHCLWSSEQVSIVSS